jgi:hypothetical protein
MTHPFQSLKAKCYAKGGKVSQVEDADPESEMMDEGADSAPDESTHHGKDAEPEPAPDDDGGHDEVTETTHTVTRKKGKHRELAVSGKGAKPRLDKRARGGKTLKRKATHINIMVAPKGGDAEALPPGIGAAPMAPKGPMAPPPGGPMGAPPLGAGAPGMPPGGAPKPVMRRGGKAVWWGSR